MIQIKTTMPTDDDTAAKFFGYEPEYKKKTGIISFGLRIATAVGIA
jgi:hypothetical protein